VPSRAGAPQYSVYIIIGRQRAELSRGVAPLEVHSAALTRRFVHRRRSVARTPRGGGGASEAGSLIMYLPFWENNLEHGEMSIAT
jgi:hypothetical protein